MLRGTVADNFASKFWETKGVNVVRYAKQDEAYLDLTAGRLDAALADALEADGGFLAKPEGAAYAFIGSRMFGANAEEKAVIGEGVKGRIAWVTTVALDYADADEVRAFVKRAGVALPVLMGDGATAADWSIRAFPTYYVIDAEGRIRSLSVGYSTWLGMWFRAWKAGF